MRKLILGLGVVFAVAVSMGALSAGAVTSRNAVDVSLNEFNVIPASQAAPAGTVTFTVKNIGKIEHEFIVVRSTKPAGSLLRELKPMKPGPPGEIGSVKSGQTKKLTLKLKAGHYALLCNLAGHYKAGQFVDFYVR